MAIALGRFIPARERVCSKAYIFFLHSIFIPRIILHLYGVVYFRWEPIKGTCSCILLILQIIHAD